MQVNVCIDAALNTLLVYLKKSDKQFGLCMREAIEIIHKVVKY